MRLLLMIVLMVTSCTQLPIYFRGEQSLTFLSTHQFQLKLKNCLIQGQIQKINESKFEFTDVMEENQCFLNFEFNATGVRLYDVADRCVRMYCQDDSVTITGDYMK